VGEVAFAEKAELLSRARALLFPLQWEEPYGLVVAEAQACGTPVLSLRRGAIPELVQHGRTGWLLDDHLDLVGAVNRVDDLDPQACRQHALESLDVSRTVRRYEQVLQWAVEAHGRQVVDLRASRMPGQTRLDEKAPALTHLLTKESS
jgi:glycosyltransferase involved in cell wall biosynthesis